MEERLGLLYDGGLAKGGALDFYEFGRASYAFARFVSTIEWFRRTNVVPKRITKAQEINVIIKASERGSFPIDIIVPAALTVATELSKVPLDILVQYIVSQIQRILPGEEDALLAAAKVQLDLEKEKTKQTKEETKRIEAIAEMVKDQNVSHRVALKILEKAMVDRSKALAALDDFDSQGIREKLQLMGQREDAFATHRGQLESIPSDKLIRLASKVRPQMADMGIPLRKKGSASVMAMTSGEKRKVIAKFDADEIKDINSRDLDEEVMIVEASFRAYDRDTGIGKFDLPQVDLKRVTFSVPPGDRTVLRPKVLDAINKDAVNAEVRFFKNKSGAITSAIIQDIEE